MRIRSWFLPAFTYGFCCQIVEGLLCLSAPIRYNKNNLKTELVYRYKFLSRKHAEVAIFEYIEIVYNKRRLHSALGYPTPEEKGLKGEKAA